MLATEHLVARTSAAIAALACVLLFADRFFADRQASWRAPSWLRGSLAIGLLVAGITTHFHFFSIPARSFFHHWEMYHYVLGAKYAQELQYDRLYACVAVADAENGHAAEVMLRPMRDLRDDGLITSAEALRAPLACTRHFSAARWTAFKSDVHFFRATAIGAGTWAAMQRDHGYNPSPVWTLLGHPLASLEPLNQALLRKLAWIDVGLLAGAGGLLCWGFGWRVGWLAALFWSTQAPSNFMWTGGAFLRQDWLLLAVAGVVFARRRRFFAAGWCLCWSSLLRVFPLLLLLGAACVIGAHFARRRRLTPEHRRFLAGAVCSGCVLLGATALSGTTADTYARFAEHVYMHSRTPISNHMSLRTLFSFAPDARLAQIPHGPDGDRAEAWDSARRSVLERRAPLHLLALMVLSLWTVRCLWRLRTLWIAIASSLLLVMTLSDPSSYYYSVFVLAAVLARARRVIEVLLMGVAAAGQMLALHFPVSDDRFAAMSALYLVFACLLVLLFSRPFRSAESRPRQTRDIPS